MMALALLMAGQATPAADLSLGAIGQQALPAKGCAAFLWSAAADRRLVAMAVADPARIRLAIDGQPADYARSTQSGAGGFGFGDVNQYRGGEVTATLDLTIAARGDLSQGAVVPAATLRIDRPGRDTLVLPVAGLIGCG